MKPTVETPKEVMNAVKRKSDLNLAISKKLSAATVKTQEDK